MSELMEMFKTGISDNGSMPKEKDFDSLINELEIDLSVVVPKPDSILFVRNAMWGTLGGVSVIMGKAKAKKTFFVSAVTAAMLSKNTVLEYLQGNLPEGKKKIFYFDTEQSDYHVSMVGKRIQKIANSNDNFRIFKLNPISTKTRFNLIDHIMSQPGSIDGVGVIIIDGIRDLLFDINNAVEASEIMDSIRRWTDENKIHIITILHANKTDDNLRGHIGTEMLNKAETVVSVKVDKKDKSVSIVSCEQSRNKPFDEFAFTINDQAIPVNCDLPKSETDRSSVIPKNISEDAHIEMINAIFENQKDYNSASLKEQVLLELSNRDWQVGINKAGMFITYWMQKGWIKDAKQKGRERKYRLSNTFNSS